MSFEQEVHTQVHTQTATTTRIAVAVALAGAGMLAAAGIAGMRSVNEAPNNIEQSAAAVVVQEASRGIINPDKGFIIEGHATRTANTVKRIEFISQIDHDVVQSGSQLTQYYTWPTLPEGHPASTQMERQFVKATRANAKDVTTQGNVAGTTNAAGTTVAGTAAQTGSQVGAELFVYGDNKFLNFTAGLPLLEFKGQRPPYDVSVRKQLAVNVDPRAAITTFLNTASINSSGVVQLNPNEEKISTDQIRKGDVSALVSGIHGLSWNEYLPDVAKPYTAEIVFDVKSHDLRRIYITGSDVDVHLYFTMVDKTYLAPVNGFIDELPVINQQNYFLDDSTYTGAPAGALKDYSFNRLAVDVGEIDRWFYAKEDKLVPPKDQNDPKGSGTDQPGVTKDPNGSSTDEPGTTNDPNGSSTDEPSQPNEPGVTTGNPVSTTDTVSFTGVATTTPSTYELWLK